MDQSRHLQTGFRKRLYIENEGGDADEKEQNENAAVCGGHFGSDRVGGIFRL